jgi:hypothetical protein
MRIELWNRLNVLLDQARIETVVTESSVEHVIGCDICKTKVPTREIEVLTYQESHTLVCRTCGNRLMARLAALALEKS